MRTMTAVPDDTDRVEAPTSVEPDPRQLLTAKQAADLLAISVWTLNDYVKKGYIRPTRLDGVKQRRYRVDEIHRFIDERTD